MALRLKQKWLWDFWLAVDGADYHIFYLQANRALGREALRHWHVSIGHAVSTDLRHWEVLPDALKPSPFPDGSRQEAFDSYTTWTGSIIQHQGTWFMFYTGSKRSEKGLIQRIGLATSSDLLTWEKYPGNPVIEADPRWYELLDLSVWHDQAWRDPFVFQHPETGEFHAFITARVKSGPPKGRGVIGHARSTDLIHWEVLPPITEPGEFGHLEVPQVVHMQEQYFLLFSVLADRCSPARRARMESPPVSGTHYMAARDPLGPYHFLTDEFLIGDTAGSHYSGKLIQGPDNNWVLLTWRMFTPEGDFIGELSDPMSVEVGANGRLAVHHDV